MPGQLIAARDRHALPRDFLEGDRRGIAEYTDSGSDLKAAFRIQCQPVHAFIGEPDIGHAGARSHVELIFECAGVGAQFHVDPGPEVAVDYPPVLGQAPAPA